MLSVVASHSDRGARGTPICVTSGPLPDDDEKILVRRAHQHAATSTGTYCLSCSSPRMSPLAGAQQSSLVEQPALPAKKRVELIREPRALVGDNKEGEEGTLISTGLRARPRARMIGKRPSPTRHRVCRGAR